MKLSKKITLAFSFAILLSIFIVGLISNSMINNRFDKYLVGEQIKRLEQISKEINELYEENGYKFYERQIASYASLENLSIKIKNLEDELLYSSDRRPKMGNMHRIMMNNYGISEGKYVEDTFSLFQGDVKVGTVIIGYIDNSYLTEGALIFKNTLTRLLFISAIVALSIGVIASIFLSNSFTKPLINIRNTALEMQRGNLNEKSILNTNTIEIKELSNSINYLGETLSKQEGIRKRYASDISHELRTPLSTLKSHVEAIIDGIWDPSEEHLTILMSEINRLSSLVDDLKDSFNSNEHGIILSKTNFNLSDDIKNIITTFKPIFNKDNISIEENIEENSHVHMDRDKMKQVMYNLLSNSVKYIDKEGSISISLKKNIGNKITIIVKDTGIGIKQSDIPYIFDRFYRADESRNKNTGGTGLGLAITKSIVEEHNGKISVKSKYGEGSEFTICLPLND